MVQSSFEEPVALKMQITPAEGKKLSQKTKGHPVLIRPTLTNAEPTSIKGCRARPRAALK
jgi:hypothetical protein